MSNKKALIISIISVVLFIIAVVSVSYAYFTSSAESLGNNGLKATTAKLNTTFLDTQTITITNMIPGDEIRKTFSIENNGMDINYKIVINELINEFGSFEDITYVLKENNVVIKEGIFPKEVDNNELSETLTIKNGETKNYEITITYQNTDEDQAPDMGKTISGKIFIKEL